MKSTTGRMKTGIIVLGFLALIAILSPGITYAASHSRGVSEQSFRMLDKHGEWTETAKFGRVWRPHVVNNWRPFLYGEWQFVDDGWYWDSYEPFGWLVYHYGNWYYIDGTGWVWIPGYDYSPAQVSWYDFDDYIAWAPLPPAGYFLPEPWDIGPVFYWNVVFVRDFHSHEIDRHCLTTRVQRPKEINRIARVAPSPERIETATHNKVEKLKVTHSDVQMGEHHFKQPQLPKEHLERTKPFRARVGRDVLKAPRMARHH